MLRIKEIAQQKGMKLKDVKDKLGITASALSQNIAGRASIERLNDIAKILGVPIYDLFEKSNITGFIEYNGTVHKVSSFEDIENILKLKK
jgi:transcriptional regulator with XRE-family HTH domain